MNKRQQDRKKKIKYKQSDTKRENEIEQGRRKKRTKKLYKRE